MHSRSFFHLRFLFFQFIWWSEIGKSSGQSLFYLNLLGGTQSKMFSLKCLVFSNSFDYPKLENRMAKISFIKTLWASRESTLESPYVWIKNTAKCFCRRDHDPSINRGHQLKSHSSKHRNIHHGNVGITQCAHNELPMLLSTGPRLWTMP